MATLNLRVLVDVVGGQQLQGLGSSLDQTGKKLTRNVTVPVVAAGAAMFKFASDADEAMNKAETVFGDASDGIVDASKNMDDAFSQATFLDTAGTFGAIAQGMGETKEESAALSEQWLSMAQDFSSFNNVPIEESLVAIRSALSGEFEPLKRFGVLLNVAKVEAKALEMGLIREGETLDDNSRLLATNALILEGMGPALGDYGRTADGAANSTKNLAANSADLAANFGEALLPIGTQIIGMVTGLVAVFTSLPEPVQSTIIAVGLAAAAIGPLMLIGGRLIGMVQLLHAAFLHLPTVMGFVDLAFGKVAGAFRALTALLLANPFIALAAAVIAIAALIILNWDKIVGFLRGVWQKITEGFTALGKTLENIWNSITNAVGDLVDSIIAAWRTLSLMTEVIWEALVGIIKGVINAVIGAINGFLGFLNGISIGIPSFDIGPVHVEGWTLDPFNIPLIPQLAAGGIITGPTLAMLGERGPEAVVPLDRAGNLNRTVNIYVQGEVRDEQELLSLFERSERLNAALVGG